MNTRRYARVWSVCAAMLSVAAGLRAQTNVVMLWPGSAPGSENWTYKERITTSPDGLRVVYNVVKPSLTVYLPSAQLATGTAVIIAPGGAFRLLSWDMEGTQVGAWLQQRGVAAFILKYRLTDSGTEEEAAARAAAPAATPGRGTAASANQTAIRSLSAADGLRAIEVVREHAAEWRIDPARVGIMGFSAGGYVALQAALSHTSGNRPAFVGAIYACCQVPADTQVPQDAPPTFFLHAYNDPVSTSSPLLYNLWKAANRPAELHTYAAGGHGFGMPFRGQPTDGWIERFGDWLRFQKLMK